METEGLAGVTAQVEKLTREAVKKTPTVLTIPGQPEGKYLLIDPDGKATSMTTDPEWHDEELDTPTDLERFIKNNKADDSAIFLSESQIVFVVSLKDRRDIAVCDLIQSQPYKWLANNPQAQNQRDFVRTLRILLRGTIDANSNLIQLVRDLKFTSGGEIEGNIQHGNESMGKKIANQVTGQGAIPEEITLRIRVFDNHAAIVAVQCALEILPAEGAFRLTPYPLEMRRAMDETLGSISNVFVEEEMPPLYRGKP